jgi:hypothetical protein
MCGPVDPENGTEHSYFSVDKATAENLKVGAKVSVAMKGKVTSITEREKWDYSKKEPKKTGVEYEIRVETPKKNITVSPPNEFSKMAEDAMMD